MNTQFCRQLLGALIGVARATEGNANRPTAETHSAVLAGMQMMQPCAQRAGEKETESLLARLHNEKFGLIPKCLQCASPCRRNDDFDFSGTGTRMWERDAWRQSLLDALLSLEPFCRGLNDSALLEETMDLIYEGFFFLGYDLPEDSESPIPAIWDRISRCRSKLLEQS